MSRKTVYNRQTHLYEDVPQTETSPKIRKLTMLEWFLIFWLWVSMITVVVAIRETNDLKEKSLNEYNQGFQDGAMKTQELLNAIQK